MAKKKSAVKKKKRRMLEARRLNEEKIAKEAAIKAHLVAKKGA